VEFLRILFLVRSCLYHILTKSRGFSVTSISTFMCMICRFITLVLRRTFKAVLISWTWICSVCMNGRLWMVLSWIRWRVIVISRCRVDIPPPTLLIGSEFFNVVPKVGHYKKVCQKVYWILPSLRPHESHIPVRS
jgi:hypothetical protein